MRLRILFGWMSSMALGIACAASASQWELQITPLTSPAGSGSLGSSLARSDTGGIWLSWVEPFAAGEHALKCARFDPTRQAWAEAGTVAQGGNWFVNWADFPTLAVAGSRLTAVWFVEGAGGGGHHESYSAQFSQSADSGKTWSAPEPVTHESAAVEFVALQPLADGKVLAVWLDGRNSSEGRDAPQTLYARLLGDTGDQLVDASVCDCCQLSLVPLATGGALLAYRGRTTEEIRDIRIARYSGGKWSAPETLHADGWEIAACPVNGPQLATNGGHVGAVWFTGAGGRSRVYAAAAVQGATEFGAPVAIDLGKPLGRVDNVMLADGTQLITWLEVAAESKPGGIYLRTVSAAGEASEPALVAPTSATRTLGFPRIALLRDGPQPQFLLTYTKEGPTKQVATLLIALK